MPTVAPRTVPFPSDKTVRAERTFTIRAVVLGALCTGFLAWFSPYAIYGLFSSRLHYCVLPPGVVAMSIALVAGNFLAARRFPRMAFDPGELVIAIGMMWLAISGLFQLGAIDDMIAIMTAPEYFATPENRWAEYFLAYIPSWAIPSNDAGAIRAFYNGLPPGAPIPWEAWIAPLFWWGSLVGALLLVMICAMAIVHEQWHDHEKLSFPMAEIPLMLVGRGDRTRPVGWMRSRLFHIGIAIPLAIMIWNMFGWFNPQFPHIRFTQDGSAIPLVGQWSFSTKTDPFALGLAYFAPVQVLRGYWLGWLLITGEMAAGQKFGFANGMNTGFEPWSDWGTSTAAWQCSGGLVMFVLWGFWIGREHYGKVLRSAFRRQVALPDRLRRRYRAAVWALIGGLAYMAFWFSAMGMAWKLIVAFLPIAVILNIGISKVIVESSFLYVENPVGAQTLVVQTMGFQGFSSATMTALALSWVVFRANAGMMMPQAAFAGKMGDEHGVPRGRMYGALGIALLVAVVVAFATIIALAYDVGAYNFQSHAYTTGFYGVYDSVARKIDDRFGPDWYRVGFFGFGAALMAAVLAIRTRWYNFWLHPVGLTFATTSVASIMVFEVFLAWCAKSVLGRLGGARLIDRAKPFFLGLVCGHSLGLVVGIIVDAIWFPGSGHYVLTGW